MAQLDTRWSDVFILLMRPWTNNSSVESVADFQLAGILSKKYRKNLLAVWNNDVILKINNAIATFCVSLRKVYHKWRSSGTMLPLWKMAVGCGKVKDSIRIIKPILDCVTDWYKSPQSKRKWRNLHQHPLFLYRLTPRVETPTLLHRPQILAYLTTRFYFPKFHSNTHWTL